MSSYCVINMQFINKNGIVTNVYLVRRLRTEIHFCTIPKLVKRILPPDDDIKHVNMRDDRYCMLSL